MNEGNIIYQHRSDDLENRLPFSFFRRLFNANNPSIRAPELPIGLMRRWATSLSLIGCLLLFLCLLNPDGSHAADHNDPNGVNSIFSDIPVSAADLYDIFGFPSDDRSGGENVVVALTFASVQRTGIFDSEVLYKIKFAPNPRAAKPLGEDQSLDGWLKYAEAVKDKYLDLKAAEVRVKVDQTNRATVDFIGFPSGTFSRVVDTNTITIIETPDGHSIKTFIGGRDDAFFNDLPGFFRSINYGPQFYRVPHAMTDARELQIPKTLLELEGNTLFNFDPQNPKHGQGVKKDLPSGPLSWSGNRFLKDEKGNYRFVYSGKDAQAGINVNAIILEVPLRFITKTPDVERIVNTWGESWVLKASAKVDTTPDEEGFGISRFWTWLVELFSSSSSQLEEEMKKYKLVDTDGVPFADAALSEREDKRQLGAKNMTLARDFVIRLGHLGWGFGPSISALGLGTCFDHDNSGVSVHETYFLATAAFPRVKKCLFQELNMPDNSWNKGKANISLKRSFEIFIPNVCAIDMDTTGTWPFGRRLEDQVATRFLSVFLDMEKGCGGKKCNLESLSDQSLLDGAPIEPKTPPNPLKNDKEFLTHFPYLADPW